ncbi:DUF2760 domain-containing protein [Cerasicoccus fimbriatus]|uniref:DUF2760 domain-containing protein n=1 Tax=Cerasicoccus fimbriatus TaxID=3014554 RepID=UPI0022B2EBD7|nr:DUF2760 domain-containing protein [Cerasicoccus sp. TK19100]
MKAIFIIGGLLVAILNGLTFVPSLAEQAVAFNALAIIAGVGLALAALAKFPAATQPAASAPEPEPAPKPLVESAPPPKVEKPAEPDHAELVQFLAQLQEKGRFIDFVMDDVTAYTDAQVGAAARVVHQGCQSVVKETLAVEPVTTTAENASITLESGYAVADYRLVGKVAGEPPYTGTLRHKGWRATSFKLPKVVAKDGTLPPIAPAQVELK